MDGHTKPCSRCGETDPSLLKSARPSRWWCTECIRDVNRDYYNRNRDRINSRRRTQNGGTFRKFDAIHDPNSRLRAFRLVEDPTGHYRARLCVFSKTELDALCEDRIAPTGSLWRDNSGRLYEVVGEQLIEDQQYVLLEED